MNLEVVSTDNTNVEVSWGSFGMMENRLILSGDMTVHGFQDSHIPGDNFSDKRNYLIQTGPQELTRLLGLGGFRAQFVHGISITGDCILSLPTGFVFITACSDCNYVRWSFSGDQGDAVRAKVALQNIIDSFPEKKQTAGTWTTRVFSGSASRRRLRQALLSSSRLRCMGSDSAAESRR